MTNEQQAILGALDPVEWRRLDRDRRPFNPFVMYEIVKTGAVERRARPNKPGAYEYRAAQTVRSDPPEIC